MEELDADLARQEALVRERRSRLAALLVQAQDGSLLPEGPVSPELTGLPAALGDVDFDVSPMAVKDREHLAFLDAATPEERRVSLMAALQEMREHAGEVYRLRIALWTGYEQPTRTGPVVIDATQAHHQGIDGQNNRMPPTRAARAR